MAADLKALAEAAHQLRHHDTLEAAKAKIDFQNVCDPATVLNLIRERDEAVRRCETVDAANEALAEKYLTPSKPGTYRWPHDAAALALRIDAERTAREAAEAALAVAREEMLEARNALWVAVDALERCYDVTEWPADGDTAQDVAMAGARAAADRLDAALTRAAMDDRDGAEPLPPDPVTKDPTP